MSVQPLFPTVPEPSAQRHTRRGFLAGSAAALLSLAACGGGGNSDVDRETGPATVAFPASRLNSVYWDANELQLYLTDNNTNSIMLWEGDDAFSRVAALTEVPSTEVDLGQLVRDPNGTFYVTRWGYGQYGAVIVVPASGHAHEVQGLSTVRQRLSLAYTPRGSFLVGWYLGDRAGGTSGAISELTINGIYGSERELITGLAKPAGVALVGDRIYVADQQRAQLLAFSLSAARLAPQTVADAQVVATFIASDELNLLTADTAGRLYVGTNSGLLYDISPTGEVRTLASGWRSVRGVAVDERYERLFVVDAGTNYDDVHNIQILPIS